jgi:hypothetical protein
VDPKEIELEKRFKYEYVEGNIKPIWWLGQILIEVHENKVNDLESK